MDNARAATLACLTTASDFLNKALSEHAGFVLIIFPVNGGGKFHLCSSHAELVVDVLEAALDSLGATASPHPPGHA